MCFARLSSAHDGDYWRLLIPGQYQVTACALPLYGCETKSVTVSNQPYSTAKTVDFYLPFEVCSFTLVDSSLSN
jgi:carboxypeptidase E